MPRDIFGDVVRRPTTFGSRAAHSLPVSIAVHVLIAALAVAGPLLTTDVLPQPSRMLTLFAAPPPPIPPELPAARRATEATQPSTRDNPGAAPLRPPDEIGEEVAAPPTPGIPVDATPFGGAGGDVPGRLASSVVALPAPTAQGAAAPIRPGGVVKYPTKIRNAHPLYPQIAILNRVEGRVIIDAVIDTDGRVKEARVLRSIPLLDQAALDAVRQWQFTPTLLNGVPVPVIITVTVNFTLDR